MAVGVKLLDVVPPWLILVLRASVIGVFMRMEFIGKSAIVPVIVVMLLVL